MGRERVVRVEDCWWCLEGLGAECWGLRQDQWTKWVWFQHRLSSTCRHRKPLEMFWRQLTRASYRQFSSLGQVSLLYFSLSLWSGGVESEMFTLPDALFLNCTQAYVALTPILSELQLFTVCWHCSEGGQGGSKAGEIRQQLKLQIQGKKAEILVPIIC